MPSLSPQERRLALLFALTLPLVHPALRGEGNGHYAWAASVVVDRDLDVENQYRRGDPDFTAATFRRADGHLWPTLETPTGRARNQFSVGPALLWAPALLEAHVLAVLASGLGLDVAADGYSRPYLWAGALTTAALGGVGLVLSYRLAASVAGATAAVLATLGVWLASSLPVYLYALPFYAHALAAFAVALFLWHWRAAFHRPPRPHPRVLGGVRFIKRPRGSESRFGRKGDAACGSLIPPPRRAEGSSEEAPQVWTPGRWAAWGALAGLMIQIDPVAASFLAVALLEWIRQALAERPLVKSVMNGVVFAASCLLVLAPQFLAYEVVHGSPLNSGRFHRFFWDEPQLFAHAFGADHGIFVWTPLALVAAAGLAGTALSGGRFFGGSLLTASAIFFYVVACGERWHTASGFGNRFLVALTPVWTVGLAVALAAGWRWLSRRASGRAAWASLAAGLALAIVWNAGLVFQWGMGLVPRREAVDFRQVAVQQFTLVPSRIAQLVSRRLGRRSTAPSEPSRVREPPP